MSWQNTGVNIFPSSPPVCRLCHCSWCFIVHRQLLGETTTGFIRTMNLPFHSFSGELADGCGSAWHGPARHGRRRHLLATCKPSAPTPVPTTPLCFTSSQGFFKVDISSFRQRDVKHIQYWFTVPALASVVILQKESLRGDKLSSQNSTHNNGMTASRPA
jgi:hypothetical protein